MLQWLVQYGVKRQQEIDWNEIDIHDKLTLEGQLNLARKNCHQLLKLLDEVQGLLVDVNYSIASHVKNVTEKAKISGERVNSLLSVDDKWIELDAKRQALQAGISIIQNELDQQRSDIRILNSSMYQKF